MALDADLAVGAPPWRLRAADAQMLRHERLRAGLLAECPWLLTFAGHPPTLAELRAHVDARLPALPQLRCRVTDDPLPFARPSWTPDPTFDLAHHVRVSTEPRHRGEAGWMRFVEERLSRPLDRERPLWELWMLDEDGGERFALVLHHHHALLDGQSGLHVLRVLLSAPRSARPESGRPSRRAAPRSCDATHVTPAPRSPRSVARRAVPRTIPRQPRM